MLTALLPDDAVIDAFSVGKVDGPFRCPECLDPVILRKGLVVVDHFAHEPGSRCQHGAGESPLHRRMKRAIYEALMKYDQLDWVHMERALAGLRPDVSVGVNRVQAAIEVQTSRLSPLEIARRTSQYHQAGVYVLWLLPFDEEKMWHEWEYMTSEVERYLHAMYFGRVFYWVRDARVYPINFGPMVRGGISASVWDREKGRFTTLPYQGPQLKRKKILHIRDSLDIIKLNLTVRKPWSGSGSAAWMRIPAAHILTSPW